MIRTIGLILVLILQAMPVHSEQTIALFSFQNRSDNPDLEWLGQGLAWGLAAKLRYVSTVQTVDPSRIRAALASAGVDHPNLETAQKIGNTVGATHILLGSYRTSGNQIQISGQALWVSTGKVQEISDISGSLEDIFALQDRIALWLLNHIGTRLTESEQASLVQVPTQSVTAYKHWVQSRAILVGKTNANSADMITAYEHINQALKLDPNYAEAHSQLGMLYVSRNEFQEALSSLKTATSLNRQRRLGSSSRCAR